MQSRNEVVPPAPARRPTLPDDGPRALSAAPATYWLVGLGGAEIRVAVDAPVLIGRGPYNHIVLDDAHASWQHARIVPADGGLLLHDLNSRNGTTVNGVRATHQRLEANDVVCFGRSAFRVERGLRSERPVTRNVETAAKLRAAEPAVLPADEIPVSTSESPAFDLRQLEDAYDNLGVLYAFVQAISQSNDTRELLESMSARIRAVHPAARAVRIHLHDEHAEITPISSTRAVAMGSTVFAPMIDRGELVGVIEVEGEPLPSRSGLDLLDSMAKSAAIVVQNTRMREAKAKRERLERDLELAAEIQKSFLPREVISVEGLELFVEYRSAFAVGGDFYDVFWVGKGKLGVFVGDISGKGVSAALHMARISSELRATALTHVDPVTVLRTMNDSVLARQQPELFFTAVYFTLDVETGAIVLANAGHPPPFLRRASGATEPVTREASSAVGMFEDATYTEVRLQLNQGDGLVLYTDGVTEARDGRGQLYGQDRLETALAAAPAGSTPNELGEHVLSSVEAVAELQDDLTFFVCQRRVDKTRSLQPRCRNSGSLAPPVIPPTPVFSP
jgi:serine phosphatase RsbU (regulator of sigma subunit)